MEVKALYDNPEYWCGEIGYRPPGYADFSANLLKEICIMWHRPKSVLDIGCAYGFTVARLRALGVDARGLDVSSYALSQADKGVREYLDEGYAWEMPYTDKRFDVVFSSGMLEHIPADKMVQTIKEIKRVSSRGIIGVACADDPTSQLPEGEEDKTHGKLRTREGWQALFPSGYHVVSDSELSWLKVAYSLTMSMLSGKPVEMS